MKVYEKATDEFYSFLEDALNDENNEMLKAFSIRYGIIVLTNVDNAGITKKAFKTLPYKVKICSPADKITKNYDVEVTIDHTYWTSLRTDEEKFALFYSILNQLEVKLDKDGMPKMDENGRIKLFKKNSDLVIECQSSSALANKYDSPEIKTMREIKTEFDEVFNLIM